MSNSIQIGSFALSINGFSVTYSYNGQTTTRAFCPHSTCDLFQSLNIIEGTGTDRNGEPVILFTTQSCGQPATGFAFWHEYVKFPHIDARMAEIIADRLHNDITHRKFQATVNRLLKPLQAA